MLVRVLKSCDKVEKNVSSVLDLQEVIEPLVEAAEERSIYLSETVLQTEARVDGLKSSVLALTERLCKMNALLMGEMCQMRTKVEDLSRELDELKAARSTEAP